MKSHSEHTLYVKTHTNGDILILSLYVDDLIITCNNKELTLTFKKKMMQEFKVTDLGLVNFFSESKLIKIKRESSFAKKIYAKIILKKFKLENCILVVVTTPLQVDEKLCNGDRNEKADQAIYKSMISNLLFITATRPGIIFVENSLSRLMQSPSQLYLVAAKRL